MTVVELALGYLAIGVALAGWAAIARAGTGALDALLLVGLWPVMGPVLALGREAGDDPAERAHRRALTAAEARLAELDRALGRPDLDQASAQARVGALEARGAGAGALAAARGRLDAIARLRGLRAMAAAEVEERREAIAQHRARVELARLGGNDDDPPDVVDP